MASSEESSEAGTITFHFIKSSQFRVIHADGAWGGLTPRGLIEMNFYSERSAIPREITHPVTDESTLGPEIAELRVTKQGIVREVDVGVIMDLAAAQALRKWLDDKIGTLEKLKKAKEAS